MGVVLAAFISLALRHQDQPTVAAPGTLDTSVPLDAPRTTETKAAESKPIGTEEDKKNRSLGTRPETGGPSLGGFFFWTLAVLILLSGVFWFLKRYGRNSRLLGSTPAIDVLARKPLATRQEVFLVEVGGKVFLIGATRDHLSTLGEIAQPDQVAILKSKCPGHRADATTEVFQKSLREGLEDVEKGTPPAPKYEGLLEELSSLKKTVASWKA